MRTITLIIALSAACTTQLDLPDPKDATITCTEECPGDLICSKTLGRCVSATSDGKPPAFVSLTATPDVAGPDTTIQIELTVDEPLGRDPEVELIWAGASADATRDAQTGNDWTFVYDVRSDDLEGFVSIVVTVVDVDGLPASSELPRAIYIDKTPPEILVDWLDLAPGASNPLFGRPVDIARDGTQLSVGLLLDEAVLSVPTIRAVQFLDGEGNDLTGPPATFDLDAGVQDDDTLFLYEHTIPAPPLTPADGTYRLETRPTDVANNTPGAQLVLDAELVIDTTPPAEPPDVDAPGLIVLQRIPWGSGETASGNTFPFMVFGGFSAAEGMHTVIAYADASRQRELETGRGTSDPSGTFGFSVGGADLPVVWLTQVDAAGNESPAAQVRDVTWIATVGPESPHVFESHTWSGDALREAGEAWQDGAALAPGDSSSVLTSGRPTGWQPVLPFGVSPPELFNHGMVYDFVRGRVVVHGGSTDTYSDQTWEWDGQAWDLACGTTSCDGPNCTVAAMAFDSARAEVVLFGGDAGYSDRCADQTWAWNGERWRLLDAGGNGSPPGLCGTTATYDPVRGKVVLFGGFSDPANSIGSASDSVWEWDGTRWAEACGGSTGCSGPSARSYTALAFDHGKEVTVMFGGSTGSGETWTWDGAAWEQRCDGVPAADTCSAAPTGRSRHTMTSHESAGVWLFGGGIYSDQLWSWDGNDWLLECGSGSSCAAPTGRRSTAMTLDTARGALVLFGGATAGGANDETWEWHNGRWVQRDASLLPPTAENSMVYSSIDDRIVLLTEAGETWEWDGSLGAWQLTCGGATGCVSPSVTNHGMVYDSDRDQVILFGGVDSDQVQVFDDGTWSLECGVGSGGCTGPTAREDHAITYDTVRHELIVFGGYDSDNTVNSDQTWLWDPGTNEWTLACGQGSVGGCTGPDARTNTAMAFDESRGVAVLHGGNGFDDTWEWNGSQWQRVCATNCRADTNAIWNHTMVYSSGRNTVLMFGGFERVSTAIFLSFDLWEWDGSTWTQLCGFGTGCVGAGARAGHAAAYDRRRSELVITGGDYNGLLDDTWRFRDGSLDRPAHVVSFRFLEALEDTPALPDPFACLHTPSECLLREVSVRATAAGTYDDGTGNAAFGTRLLAWKDNAWRVLDTFSGSATPSELVFALDAGDVSPIAGVQREIGGLLLGRDYTMTLALTPDGDNGALTDFGTIETDTVELEVRYRLP